MAVCLLVCDGGKNKYSAYGSYKIFNTQGEQLVERWVTFEEGTTSNQSEYKTLIEGLKDCLSRNLDEVMIFSDSALVVNQVYGDWVCKNKGLQSLLKDVHEIRKNFSVFKLYKANRTIISKVLGH